MARFEDKRQGINRLVKCLQSIVSTTYHQSIGNMTSHVKKCWGEESYTTVKDSTLDKARNAIKTLGKKSQSKLTLALKTVKGWAQTFSTHPPDKEITRYISPTHITLTILNELVEL